jgi:hypothetical protein
MFVVQNQFIKNGANSNFKSKEPKDKGAREFRKLISFLSFRDRLVLQRAPLFINQIFFKMQNHKREKSSKEQLAEIKAELQALNPELKRLKVKKFYNQGRVIAHAHLGNRRIHVKSSLNNIVDKFIAQYNERYPTAFSNFNTI